MREQDSVEVQSARLKEAYYGQPAAKRSLWWAIIKAFGRELCGFGFLGFISMIIGLCMPFFVKALVAYIDNGENPTPIEFPVFEDPWLAVHLPPNRQYGLSVAITMVLVQGATYVLDENRNYGTKMLGAKASNALVAMLYEK